MSSEQLGSPSFAFFRAGCFTIKSARDGGFAFLFSCDSRSLLRFCLHRDEAYRIETVVGPTSQESDWKVTDCGSHVDVI